MYAIRSYYVQRRQALRDQILVWREAVVGQGFPVRQHQRLQLRRQPVDLVLQAQGIGRAGRDDPCIASIGAKLAERSDKQAS